MFPLMYAYGSPSGTRLEMRPHLEMLRVWRSRSERDVAPELMRFLQHETLEVRYDAAILLSYLEYAPAEEPLRALLERAKEAEKTRLDRSQDRLRLQFALARIQARDLKGQAKVEAVAAGIGRNLDTLIQTEFSLREGHVAPEQLVYLEVFELLYSMAKKGENIELLKNKLQMFGHYKLLLEGASLPPDEEVTRVLDYLEKRKVGGTGGYLSNVYLPNAGTRARNLLLERLQDMVERPERHFSLVPASPEDIQFAEKAEKEAAERGGKADFLYLKRPHYAHGYSNLFRAASASDDARFLPVLKQLEEKFQDDPDTRVRESARSAQEMLQRRLQILQTPDEAASPPK